MIKPMPRDVHEYLARFDLVSIALTRNRRLIATRDPVGAEQAFWCAGNQVGTVVRAAQRNGGDVVGAARRLAVPIAEHAAMLAKVTKAVRKIDAGIEWARRTGALRQINAEYKRRRLEAQREGEVFMDYREVTRRLQCAMADAAAGAPVPRDLVARVFDGSDKSGPLST
jgi:hypothetical protein